MRAVLTHPLLTAVTLTAILTSALAASDRLTPSDIQRAGRPFIVYVMDNKGNPDRARQRFGPTWTDVVSDVWRKVGVTNHSFDVRVAQVTDTINHALRDGADFVFSNPAVLMELMQEHQFREVVSMESLRLGYAVSQFGGLIITNTAATHVQEPIDCVAPPLNIGVVSFKSFGGYVMQIKHLVDAGMPYSTISDPGFVNLRTQPGVIDGVNAGNVTCGFIRTDQYEGMLRNDPARVRNVRPVGVRTDGEAALFPFNMTTALYAEWGVVAAPHVLDSDAKLMRLALQTIRPTDAVAAAGQYSRWFPPQSRQQGFEALWDAQLLRRPRGPEPQSNAGVIGAAVGSAAGVLLLAVVALLVMRLLRNPNRYAPTNAAEPVVIAHVGLRGLADLDAEHSGRVRIAQAYAELVRRVARASRCHVASRTGDFFVVLSHSAAAIKTFAEELQRTVEAQQANVMTCSFECDARERRSERRSGRSGSSPMGHRAHRRHSKKSSPTSRDATSEGASSGDDSSARATRTPSHTSRRTPSSARRSNDKPHHTCSVTASVAIALHAGPCTIDYDADTERYDYHGSVLAECAALLDAVAPGQVLASEGFQEALMDAGAPVDVQLLTALPDAPPLHASSSGELSYLQFNVDGVVKTFAAVETVESAVAAADLASGRFTRKPVTVVAARLGSLYHATGTSTEVTPVAESVTSALMELATKHHGDVATVLGDLAIVTWNVAAPTGNQTERAVKFCEDLVVELGPEDLSPAGLASGRSHDWGRVVTCGVASGPAFVGTGVGGAAMVTGPLVSDALALEAACRELPLAVPVCVGDDERFSKHAALQYVGLRRGNGAAWQPVLAVSEIYSPEDDDEWLYAMKARADSNPFTAVNDVYRQFVEAGDATAALAGLAKVEAAAEGGCLTLENGALAAAELRKLLATATPGEAPLS